MLKIPPQDLEAEKSLLGALMIDKNAIIKVADLITAEDFYQPVHTKIYDAVLELFKKSEPIDVLTVTNKLKDRNLLSEIGGSSYLADLINMVPSSAHVFHYGKIVHQKKILRDLIQVSGEITEQAFNNQENVENVLDIIEQKIFSISQQSLMPTYSLIKAHLNEAYERIEKMNRGERALRGVTSGFNELDKYLSGFQGSDLIILGARPSLGKTSLVLDFVRNASRTGVPVAIFSLEMSKDQIIDRLIAAEAQVDLWRLRTGRLTDEIEFEMIREALDRLSKMPIIIDDAPSPTILQLRSMARRMQMDHGLGLIVIDYVQLIVPQSASENIVQQFTEISHSLKALARELNVPVLAVSQLNRAVDQREIKIPRLSDLRETGCLTADTLIYNPFSGTQISIKELINKKDDSDVRVLSITDEWQTVSQPIAKVFSSGRKKVYELTTRCGRKIKASANHPFRKLNSWVKLADLKIKDKIALPRFISEPSNPLNFNKDRIILLAHLIGDGCYLKKQPLHYTNADENCLRIVAQSAKEAFGINSKWVKQKNWWHLYLTSSGNNSLISWLKELETHNQRSYEKIIPQFIFQLNNADLALFIKHLWATDGTVYFNKSSNNWVVSYTSTSEKLIKDLQFLLLRFGIISTARIHKKIGYRNNFDLHIQGAQNQKVFLKEIGVFGKKESLASEALKELELIIPNPNLDVIPKEIWETIREEKDKIKISWREFSSRLEMSYCGSTLFKKAPSRKTMIKIATQCLKNNQSLLRLANSDIYWDEIVSIKPLGIEEVYDISVNEPHNFLANGIFVHNSWEQDADVVMFIYRKDRDKLNPSPEEINTAELIISKHRNGPLGTVQLKFDPEKASFREITSIHE